MLPKTVTLHKKIEKEIRLPIAPYSLQLISSRLGTNRESCEYTCTEGLQLPFLL